MLLYNKKQTNHQGLGGDQEHGDRGDRREPGRGPRQHSQSASGRYDILTSVSVKNLAALS